MPKISQLPEDTNPSLTSFVPHEDVNTTTTKKVKWSSVLTLLFGNAPSANIVPSGVIVPYAGFSAPTGWLLAYGQTVNRQTSSALFNVLVPSLGSPTITIASPAVVTLTAHGLQSGDQIYLTTTGALPTGLSANTLYYGIKIDANTFYLSTSRANSYAGTKINTSGSQSGVHTLYSCPYGLGDGSTTFTIPDLRGRQPAGSDNMGGTPASRLTLSTTQGAYGNAGATGGEQAHQLITSELASHSHTYPSNQNVTSGANFTTPAVNAGTPSSSNSTGGDVAHNNVAPTIVTNYIIKT